MLRFTLLSAVLAAASVRATVVSNSVFPNSACAGAGSSLSGLVGVGQVTLSSGEVELHCGCPSDNLENFEVCPGSAAGQAVCNSVLNLESGAFTATCGTVTCSGAECQSAVTNEVVIDQDECYNSEKGAVGIAVIDGEAKCGCASDALGGEFTACASPANGHATCREVDSDFLGVSYAHEEKVSCAVVCDEGYFLTPGGSCVTLAKRAVAGPSGAFHTGGPGKVGPSASWTPSATPIKVGPSASSHWNWHSSRPTESPSTTSRHPHAAHTTSGSGSTTTTTSYSYKHHHHHTSSEHGSSSRSHDNWRSTPIKVGPSATPTGHHGHHHTSAGHHHSLSGHHHHHSSTHDSWKSTPIKVGPSPTTSATFTRSRGPGKVGPSAVFTEGPGKVGPSQRARRAAEEFVFSDVCAQDERTCPSGDFGDFTCVRLDDVTECGGCNANGEATNCLEIDGASSVACLRGGCVVRSCQTGFAQTAEGACEKR
ncbi:hypothetical protein JCM8547_005729 [Rhodosporidiobolus lusitaniae]